MAIDSTVGRETFFVATWQAAEPPEIILIDPTGRSYTVKDFELDSVFHVARLQIPGTAEVQLVLFLSFSKGRNILTLYFFHFINVMLIKII